jgi:predicted nuclease with TOPRIM domain
MGTNAAEELARLEREYAEVQKRWSEIQQRLEAIDASSVQIGEELIEQIESITFHSHDALVLNHFQRA